MSSTHFPCVYVYYDANDECLYIGSTRKLPAWLTGHVDAVFWPEVARMEMFRFEDYSEASAVEHSLIRMYAPRFNIDGVVDRDEQQDRRTRAHQRGQLCGWHNCRLCLSNQREAS